MKTLRVLREMFLGEDESRKATFVDYLDGNNRMPRYHLSPPYKGFTSVVYGYRTTDKKSFLIGLDENTRTTHVIIEFPKIVSSDAAFAKIGYRTYEESPGWSTRGKLAGPDDGN